MSRRRVMPGGTASDTAEKPRLERSRAIATLLSVLMCIAAATLACGERHARLGRRVIVLGFDGLDYSLTRDLMARGRMPNFARLAASGSFAPLGTSIPPQSPVAWSNFITGLDPGGHGIFDFIHRDPKTMVPYLSTTKTEPASWSIKIGKWQFPLSSGKVELLRHGTPFWALLEQHGIESTIVRMPANFPPSGEASHELSGMGTPDILGTYGTFSFYASGLLPTSAPGPVPGGVVYQVDVVDNAVHAVLEGPDNPFLRQPEKVSVPFSAHIDAGHQSVKLAIGKEERLLRVGEWSDWVPVEFDLDSDTAASCRGALLPEAARSRFRALCQPAQHRPALAGDARFASGAVMPASWRVPPAGSTHRGCPKTPRV